MGNFQSIKEALEYIDEHLDEPLSFELLAARFHFSPYYFHRVFSEVVGKTIADYIRERRLDRARLFLTTTKRTVIDIGMECGFASAQSFSRAFRGAYGLSPSQYRASGRVPQITSINEMIMRFTNRLKGGMVLKPKLIWRDGLAIAGVSGDADRTAEVWQAFEALSGRVPLPGKQSESGYEVRVYGEAGGTVHVGFAVSGDVNPAYEVLVLPPSHYASFDVYVENGYDSENSAMDEWLRTNDAGLRQRFFQGKSYVVEYYDERFHGNAAGSIVEIWLPVAKEFKS